jgi:2-oxoglutarate dehydrogenase E1 component
MEQAGPALGVHNLELLEELYASYLSDPHSVSADWREYFSGWGQPADAAALRGPRFSPPGLFSAVSGNGHAVAEATVLQDRVDQLIRAYRVWGHMAALLDPLGRPRPVPPELDPAYYGLRTADLKRSFSCATISGPSVLPLQTIIARLQETYCRSIGVQFMHITDNAVKTWLQERMEGSGNRLALAPLQQLRILTKLTDAVIFEEFIQKKYLGAKRFSLEGGESLIPLLQLALDKAGVQGVHGVVIGMAHRGRLSVLANIIGKSAWEIFREFEDAHPEEVLGRGDVKYHMGYSTRWKSSGGSFALSLCFNPSHLEYVNTVALGRVRANQDRRLDRQHLRGMGILIHGDAAFAGEGIVQETLNLSQLEGYKTGGTLHIIVNNQLGFTTEPVDSRSCDYATDVARMLQIPIFHVNSEDPEALAQTVELALDFRRKFQRDVVIDMYCYRRFGHNEADEPSFTQPLMYKVIKQRSCVRDSYLDHLLKLGSITKERADEISRRRRQHLEAELEQARTAEMRLEQAKCGEIWSVFLGGPESGAEVVETGFPQERLSELLVKLTEVPEDFKPHPKIERWLGERRRIAAGELPVDWSAAEALAFASLAVSRTRVRLTGQDAQRGTFSHRHSVLHDVNTGAEWKPLQRLMPKQGPVEIFNSPLSEAGVLGYEYGYSLDYPDGLVIWEAQFGDFANAAQVIIDQFVASAEDKWRYLSGLVLLLPHGFEGAGAEHSSARLERFLVLAADDNMQIANVTTPAQYFHLLRRQALRRWRKPLVVMTPKSLLRHPQVVSSLDELAGGSFERILPDSGYADEASVSRVLLCSGKIYYELAQRRAELGRRDVAILRLEQIYPLDQARLQQLLAGYPAGVPVVWVQEEPENMGAWHWLYCLCGAQLPGGHLLCGVSRAAAASPATGSHALHLLEQEQVISAAFATDSAK